MRLFQFVGDRTAEAIFKVGFEDLPFQAAATNSHAIKSVRLFDNPNGSREEPNGAPIDVGKVMLAVEIPGDALSGHEIVMLHDETEIQEFIVPASVINSFGPPKIADVGLNWPGLLDDIYTDDIGEDPE